MTLRELGVNASLGRKAGGNPGRVQQKRGARGVGAGTAATRLSELHVPLCVAEPRALATRLTGAPGSSAGYGSGRSSTDAVGPRRSNPG